MSTTDTTSKKKTKTKTKTTTTLLIVESPAKCKKIEEYLGPGYKCIASFGHLRTIASLNDIDIANQFHPTYTFIDNAIKKKQIEHIRKEIQSADYVMLASDMDREGEAISYSIMEIFQLPATTKRITFNEITETALRHAVAHPKTIDMDLVRAQQARQILDILVGFKVTNVLWKCIATPKGKDNVLSAGRCQTPALRLIYENEEEQKAIVERKVYNVTGFFTSANIQFALHPVDKYDTEEKIQQFLRESINFSHIYTCSKPTKIEKLPPEPLITSSLQQCASNELHYSPKETMRLCQLLYEAGYITYMRTDAPVYSAEFIETIKEYITRTYDCSDGKGQTYVDVERYIKCGTKKDGDGDRDRENEGPHEAIRPTNISLCDLPETIEKKGRRLYTLIRETTLESCMCPATFWSVQASITACQHMHFTYTSELIDFPGWKIVTKKYTTENKEFTYLQTIKQNAVVPYKKLYAKVCLQGRKSHYTEARLIQVLKDKGIGRPSTFSSLVDKIQERGYVKKEDIQGKELLCKDYVLESGDTRETEVLTKREFGNEKGKLVLLPLGRIVMEFLETHFAPLFDYQYTSLMEDALDRIAKGDYNWVHLCEQCNTQVDTLVSNVKDTTKLEIQIDDNHTYMVGKYGPVIKCVDEKEAVTFKPVKKDISPEDITRETPLEDIIDNQVKKKVTHFVLGQYNGTDVIIKKGRFGVYITWDNEQKSKSLKDLGSGNRPIENITLEEVMPYLEEGETPTLVREITASMSIRKSPKGDYLFYKTTKMKKPAFYDVKKFGEETGEDYKTCKIAVLKSWIKDRYGI